MSEEGHKAPLEETVRVHLTNKPATDYRQVAEATRLIHDQREQLERAKRDPVTLLPNLVQFEEDLPRIMKRHEHVALIILDLDGLKRTNDINHAMGDQYLKIVAEAIASTKRTEDLAFRIGGDEFAILIPEFLVREGTEPEGILDGVRKRYESVIDESIKVSDLPQDLYLGASVGIGIMQPEDTPESFRARAFASEEAHKAERRKSLAEEGVIFQDPRRLA